MAYFTLDGRPVLSPDVMLRTCTDNGFDVEPWLGKANSFVESRGIDPSYGYFLVDGTTIGIADTVKDAEGQEGYEAEIGSNKFTLGIAYDELNDEDEQNTRLIEDMYVDHYINITPGWNKEDCFYLIKLVDVRFVFSHPEASEQGIHLHESLQWFNKVQVYLTPQELKDEYRLEELPPNGEFIYDEKTTPTYNDGTRSKLIGTKEDSTEVRIPIAYTWKELFEEIISIYGDSGRVGGPETVFPYFETNEYPFSLIVDPNIQFPEFVPQNIDLRYCPGQDILRSLLFWTKTSMVVDGPGRLKLIPVTNPKSEDDQESTELQVLVESLGAPIDKNYNSLTTTCNHVPESFSLSMRIIDRERENNEKQEYHSIHIPTMLEDDTDRPPTSRRVVDILIPHVWTEERDYFTLSTTSIEEKERLSNISEHYDKLIRDKEDSYFSHFPQVDNEYTGFHEIEISPWVERVSYYDLGDGPVTRIQSPIPITDWSWLEPKPIIPREHKFSIILAKFSSFGEQNTATFTFKEPRVLVGEGPLPLENSAYNTFRQNFTENDNIILVKGYNEEWRDASKLIESDLGEGSVSWYTINNLPYLRLKVPKQEGDGPWTVSLDDVEVVNGRLPISADTEYIPPDGDDPETPEITIHNNGNIVLEDSDTHFYVSYDATVGTDALSHWSTADAQNFILMLKGIDGFGEGTDETPFVLTQKKDTEGANSIVWAEAEGGDGTGGDFEDEVNQLIEQYIIDNGIGGTGTVTMLRALVDDEDGVSGSDTTFNFKSATALVSAGATPTSGSCDNTFNRPFVDNEPILLLKKTNGMYSAVKVQQNIIRANVSADVRTGSSTFEATSITLLSGTAPTAPITVKNVAGIEYRGGDPLILTQHNDGQWIPLRNLVQQAAIFRTTGQISAAVWNGTTLTTGSGSAYMLTTDNGSTYTAAELPTGIRNMAPTAVGSNKIIQAKRIGGVWFVDVETCT